jgi:hypothetical protein
VEGRARTVELVSPVELGMGDSARFTVGSETQCAVNARLRTDFRATNVRVQPMALAAHQSR